MQKTAIAHAGCADAAIFCIANSIAQGMRRRLVRAGGRGFARGAARFECGTARLECGAAQGGTVHGIAHGTARGAACAPASVAASASASVAASASASVAASASASVAASATASATAPRRRLRGFTLIELMVVIALMALAVGLAPLAYGRLHESAEYRAAVSAAVTALRAARQQAQATGAPVRFAVNLNTRSFGVEGQPPYTVPEPLQLRTVMAEGESDGQGGFGIRFLPMGGASGGSLDILRASGEGVRLRVDWFTGRVEQEAALP